ncbi:MAG: condensation domain-containing protein, partial [Myxococcota bacterium]
VVNGYGPTENTVFTCCYRAAQLADIGRSVPIGHALNNTQVYILDRYLNPVPDGVSGELYAAGDGLARGYQRRPGLTAQRFLPNPFSVEPGARMYRTGDIVCRRPNGVIEFIGRSDGQVKVRGFRIELGEIESALSSRPEVTNSAAIVRTDAHSIKQILAYVVLTPSATVTGGQLRDALRDSLPAFMLPTVITVMDSLPLTPNGKLDRRALPDPVATNRLGHSQYVAPRTETEVLIATRWSEFLAVDTVGLHDDFFALGGHSLIATQLISRLHKDLTTEIPLHVLFERPTVAQLAAFIEGRPDDVVSAPPLEPVARSSAMPLSFAQQRLWFIDQFEPNSASYNISVALHISGVLDVRALRWSLEQIAVRHEVLRTHFVSERGQPVQVIADEVRIPVSVNDLSALSEDVQREQVDAAIT